MKIAWFLLPLFLFVIFSRVDICFGQDYDVEDKPAAPPPEQDECNGIFLTYTFTSREKLYPHVKNVSAQAWGFKSEASIINAGDTELKAWKMFIGFQHREILVSASNVVVVDGDDLPAAVGNGTTLAGNPMTDLKTSIETAGDYNQIQVRMEFTGTQFGLKPSATPMPKTIKLVNDGFKCPAPRIRGKTYMHVCCKKDPKYKVKKPIKTKFFPRQNGDLSLTYDILEAYTNNYQAQVTIDNNHPLGRLDHWNLTWEWMRGEFIYNMRGAYTHKKDPSECIYGPAGKYYQDFDFSKVMNCAKKPIISDLPRERAEDKEIGKLPYCCKNGTILPALMDESQARSIFQLQVYKLPPDMNRTALNPPMRWKINGVLNPEYRCAPPIRVDPTEFPDPSGLQTTTSAIASWQVICNITRPKPKAARCCVSFSAFYNESVIPCNTCACGCPETNNKCNPNAHPMLLPAEALLVPFANRTEKAKAYAALKHFPIPRKLPCPDNCPLSINWHVTTDHKSGWTARITLFNWEEFNFENWFTAIQLKKASRGYENVYSFNGTMLPELNRTIFMQGLKGLNYLMGETNGTHTYDPRVPGKQQSVISFTKKGIKDFKIQRDGFPTKVFFNGEECALPTTFPTANSGHKSRFSLMAVIFIAILTFVLMTDHFI
ncbi:COBRA protein [Quillaja saponaria]|uniref:COBRA protein n=1 Tax=Quillaja saponaria TaxID=32244 RepID=A0AAD7QHL1_QUISA|nr:COBRA protein [Quillaja saponaria]KAJ7981605.1 COBRA protein [Quillaja saponaria]